MFGEKSPCRCAVCEAQGKEVKTGLVYVRGYFFCREHDSVAKVDDWVVLQQAKQCVKETKK